MGQRWRFSDILWLSGLLNVASFFFTLRPHLASALVPAWVLFFDAVEDGLVERFGRSAYVAAVLFAPLIVNIIIYLRHQSDLGPQSSNDASEA